VAKLVKIGQKTKFILILLDNYSLQMYQFRRGLSKLILPSIWILLFTVCLLAPFVPTLVASFYTQVIFRYGASGLRFLFGSIPFAMGEFIYIIIIILLIINALKHINSLKSFNYISQKGWFILTKLTWLIVKLYVVFQLIWGLNYMQPDPTKDFHLRVQTPKNAQIALSEMNALTNELIEELNKTKAEIRLNRPIEPNFEQVMASVQLAYQDIAIK